MGMYIVILFKINLEVYLPLVYVSNICMGKDNEINIKLHTYVFSIEISKIQAY